MISNGLDSAQFIEIVAFNFGVFEDLVEQAWPKYLACVNWNDGRTAIWMAHEVVTALGANENKSDSYLDGDALDANKFRWRDAGVFDFDATTQAQRPGPRAGWIATRARGPG